MEIFPTMLYCAVTRRSDDAGAALREGLNSSSLSLWDATSSYTSRCMDSPRAQIYTSTGISASYIHRFSKVAVADIKIQQESALLNDTSVTFG